MSLSCLTNCKPGDKVTICYTSSAGDHMSRKLTPFQREFTVVSMVDYYNGDRNSQLLMPMVGSNKKIDGMHPARGHYGDPRPQFDYEWMVHPSYNYVVKIRKKHQ